MPIDQSTMMAELLRTEIIDEAFRHMFKPYRMGANGPEEFDCSALVIYVLNKIYPPLWSWGDDTAHGIHNRFKKYTVSKPYKGCLTFWGTRAKISHVAFCVNEKLVVGANGRDRRRVTVEPIDYRKKYYDLDDFVAYCDPVIAWRLAKI